MNYFISDLHFCHTRVLTFTSEQAAIWREHGYNEFQEEKFADINQYNETLISRWNSKVKEDDNVYILGDCGIGSTPKIIECLKQLKGNKHLIKGNHDFRYKNMPEFTANFVDMQEQLRTGCSVNKENVTVFMSHYPLFDWDQKCHNYVGLYGHVHNVYIENSEYLKGLYRVQALKTNVKSGMAVNVGAMMPWMNYCPQTLEEIYNNAAFQSINEKLKEEALKDLK